MCTGNDRCTMRLDRQLAGLTAAALVHSSIPGVVMQALIGLGVALVVLWAFLWLGLKIAAGAIHILFLLGLVLVIWGLIKRGARAIT